MRHRWRVSVRTAPADRANAISVHAPNYAMKLSDYFIAVSACRLTSSSDDPASTVTFTCASPDTSPDTATSNCLSPLTPVPYRVVSLTSGTAIGFCILCGSIPQRGPEAVGAIPAGAVS
jgi:hypothetical protein